VPAVDDRGWRLLFLLRPAALSFRLLFLLRSAAVGSWRLLLLLRPATLDRCLLLPLLRLSARGGLQVLLLLCPAALRPAALSSWRLLLLLRPAALSRWWLQLLLRPATLDGCLLLPQLRFSARGDLQVLLLLCSTAPGWRLLLLLRPAALSPVPLLIRSPALNPWLRLLSQSLFLILLLLMLLLLIAAYWCLTGRREAFARNGHGWRRSAAAINTRTSSAIARGRLAGSDLSMSILVGGDIYFTVVAFVGQLEGLWLGHRQRHMPASLGHIDLARKQHYEPTRMANAVGDATGIIAGAPIEIGARRSDDRRSRILRNHETTEG